MPSVLVTGAGRGLGLEFARQYAADGWNVIATVRDAAAARELAGLSGEVRVESLDMRDHAALAALAERIDGPLDLVIANAAIFGPKRLADASDAAKWLEVFDVNVVAPTLLAETLVTKVVAARGKLVAITSEMGSIADNRSGGMGAYRAAKAALNAAWRSLAIDWSAEPIAIAMLHPGWVKTDMGGAGAALEIPDSVAALRRVIAGLGPADKGVFLNYQGQSLPW